MRSTFNYLPTGTIVSWTGTTAPEGWALCNGQNGTPNLQGRFIFGLNPAGGKHAKVPGADYNQLNGVGGNQIHQLTAGEMPSHTHPYDDAYYAEAWGPNKRWGNRLAGSNKGADGDNAVWTARWNTEPVGGNEVHNTMPPYYILAFIMKL
jgi:microcystin-dependent protein